MSQDARKDFAPEQPQLWRLGLAIEPDCVCALTRSVADDTPGNFARIALAPGGGTSALEDAIYSVPGLLADYKRVDIAYRTASFTTVPHSLDAEARADAAFIMGITGEDADVLHGGDIRGCGATLLWSLPDTAANFLARTFRNPRMHHPLALLGSYFAGRATRGNRAKTFVHFNGNATVDIAAFDASGALLMLTSKTAAADADALYFILAALKANDFNPTDDELLLCGSRSRRESLSPVLRKYVAKVLPLIFPSEAYLSGGDAAPFPLTVMMLCE